MTDNLVYKLVLPKTPHQSDIAQRTLRIYIDKQLVKVDDVGIAASDYKLVVPQDSEVTLVMVHADDAKPEPNVSESEPYVFMARDLTPPPVPFFPFPVEYVGEEAEDDSPSTETNTTLPPVDDSTTTVAPDESTTTLPPVEDSTTSTETLPPLPEETTSTEVPAETTVTEVPSETTETESPTVDTPVSLPPADESTSTEPVTDTTETELPPVE